MSSTTIIRNAAWIVAWDEANRRHAYLRDSDVVFTGAEIVHVGPGYEGPVDTEVDGREHAGRDAEAMAPMVLPSMPDPQRRR